MHQHMSRCGKRKEKLADFLIQAFKQGALGILATVLRVLLSAKKQKQILNPFITRKNLPVLSRIFAKILP